MQALKEYLDGGGIMQKTFASQIGISQEYLSRIIQGRVTPGPVVRKVIEHETDGKIKEDAWT